MKYPNIIPAIFLRRPNRFIAYVDIEGKEQAVHVKNTGRCRELLLPGAAVYLTRSESLTRKTAFDLIAVEKKREGKPFLLINMDAQAPNEAAAEWLPRGGIFSPFAVYRREVRFGDSRFDFFVEDEDRRAFVEVKGVTLEKDGVAFFPDAPTERGVKHLSELCEASAAGYEAYVLFVVQMKEITEVRPNDVTHRAFGDALRRAVAAGVRVLAVDCHITPDSITADALLPVEL